MIFILLDYRERPPYRKGVSMSAERTDFVDVLPTQSLKTLLSLVRGDKVSARDASLAVDNVVSYGLGQFLPGDSPVIMLAKMQAAPTCTQEEAVAMLEAAAPDADGTMKAGKIDWKSLLGKVIPFILTLLV